MKDNCWDFFECPDEDRKKCPAWSEGWGKHCWMIAASNIDIVNSGVPVTNGVKHCFSCDYFNMRHQAGT